MLMNTIDEQWIVNTCYVNEHYWWTVSSEQSRMLMNTIDEQWIVNSRQC